jgi:hypothetical protein
LTEIWGVCSAAKKISAMSHTKDEIDSNEWISYANTNTNTMDYPIKQQKQIYRAEKYNDWS